MNENNGIEIGISTIGDHLTDPLSDHKLSEQDRILTIIEAAKLADEVGLDVFAVGESHQPKFASPAHTVILGAIAQATQNIKILSSVTVLSTADPVRVYEDFSTIDLISNGRAEIAVGRGSRLGAFDLFGYHVNDYEELFEEKLDLLTKINEEEKITWAGKFRPPLVKAEIFPKPLNGRLPIWRAVGGSVESAVKAGRKGHPMMLTTLAGRSTAFKVAVDAFREEAQAHGYSKLPLTTTSWFYAANDSDTAFKEFYPYINNMSEELRGGKFSEHLFLDGKEISSALMVGSPQQIIEKILFQYEMYGHQRFLAHVDVGGMPFEKIMSNIEFLATKILPTVKKATMR